MPVSATKDAAGKVEGYEAFIKYLPADTTEPELRKFFAEAGQIVGEARLMTHPQSGKCKGVGWVTFATEEGLATALSWNGCRFGGRNLSVTVGKVVHTGFRPSVQAHGTHTPALIQEVIAKMVAPDPDGVYVDGTFGRGGHSRGILDALSPRGSLHAFDMDPDAIKVANELAAADKRFHIHHSPFGEMETVLSGLGVQPAGVFFDLGISSPQFDEAHRGFRPEADGPLDLRFDQTKGEPAWQFLQRAEREELVSILHEYGETTDPTAARRIADAICLARARNALPKRTREFASLVAQAKGHEYQAMHPAKLAFQALRVHLNREFDEMRRGMAAAFALLPEGGRIGLITWKHSECAIVVDYFRSEEAVREELPLLGWYRAQPAAAPLQRSWALTIDEAVRPSDRELSSNSRSRSAVLHVLRKVRATRVADLEDAAYPLLGWSAPGSATGGGVATDGRGAEQGGEGAARKGKKEKKVEEEGGQKDKMKKDKKDKGDKKERKRKAKEEEGGEKKKKKKKDKA